MTQFRLQVASPDGLCFEGDIVRLIARTTEGDVGILARHADYTAVLAAGKVRLGFADAPERTAVCSEGLLCVSDGTAYIAAGSFAFE